MKKPPRRSDDSLISPCILFRYMVIGLYVGLATVGIFIIWYTNSSFFGIDLSQDGHTLVSYSQLANWGQCSTWGNFTVSPFTAGNQVFTFNENPCDYFQTGYNKVLLRTHCKICLGVCLLQRHKESNSCSQGQYNEACKWSFSGILQRSCKEISWNQI